MWIKDWLRSFPIWKEGTRWKPVAIFWCDIEDEDEISDIEDWCDTFCKGRWKLLIIDGAHAKWCEGIAFSRDIDAVLFRLFYSDTEFIFDETGSHEMDFEL